ncbi:hypothetical protein NQ317_000957 [Molorchus minor]|uniref:Integrase catalytic domain-containing protein n=1 Tax=Molorchus minor TaxID=1323400 RepID=A0ABQ9JAA8_9CUCU|nr:hypothetical protein NQ317_000957 [Molorchus minor]
MNKPQTLAALKENIEEEMGNLDEKRRILARLLERERTVGGAAEIVDPQFNFDTERDAINATLESIKSLIDEFEGPTSDSLYKRIKSRLAHVSSRVHRMSLDVNLEQYELQLLFKNESYATCLHLDAELHEKVVRPNIVANNVPEFREPLQNAPITVNCGSKTVPVYKLALQFNGESKKLLSFIERVEELAQARHISKSDLFESACDLFTGKATFWLRQVKPQVTDWDSLIERLKQDFLKSDFDEEIWEQIKSRYQGKYESVVIFIACLESLFSRLSRPAIELTKIKYIRKGLQPEYRKRLALQDINSVADLSKLCKKLEEADILDLESRSSRQSSSNSLIDPELAYVSGSRPQHNSTGVWCTGRNGTYLYKMSGKLIEEAGPVGHHPPPKIVSRADANLKQPSSGFFDKNDWLSWIHNVKNFYVNYNKLNSVAQVSPLFCLLDSGATMSFIGAKGLSLLKKLDLKLNPSVLKTVATADGTEQPVMGVVDLPILINNTCEVIKALVVPALTQAFIFGNDFCNTFQIRIDFREKTWDVRSNFSSCQLGSVSEINQVDGVQDLCTYEGLSVSQRHQVNEIIDSFKEISSDSRIGRTEKISQKLANTARMGLMGSEKPVKYPFQIIAVDIMGPFPRSSKGNCYLLVVGDWFSKYTLLHPMRQATAQNVVKFIENHVFLAFGVPQFIICDNGTQFAGRVFKKLADTYQVQKIWFSPRYAAQCNFVERNNKTVGTAIRCYVEEHKDWDQELSKIQHAINTAKHEVTGYSPAFLVFGRHVPLSGKYYGQVTSTADVELLPGDRGSYAEGLTSLSQVFSEVRHRIHLAYQRNAAAYNLRKRDISFEVGDKVWRRNKVLSDAVNKFAAKLAPKSIGTDSQSSRIIPLRLSRFQLHPTPNVLMSGDLGGNSLRLTFCSCNYLFTNNAR